MRLDRSPVRFALPPVLALGMTAALMNPLWASPAPGDLPATGSRVEHLDAAATGSTSHVAGLAARPSSCPRKPRKTCTVPTPPGAVGGIAVSIPPVAFPEVVRVEAGRLRTPVLLASDKVRASARVEGAKTGPGCTAQLKQGVPAWLDCTISVQPGATPRVVVTLSDGRTATKAIQPA